VSTTAPGELALREQIVRTDRMIEETRKFSAKAAKLNRDRAIAPWQIVVAGMEQAGRWLPPPSRS
jgi:hypothetical protein